MSSIKTIPVQHEAPTTPSTTGQPGSQPPRSRRSASPWAALGAVLVVGGAISVAAYLVADDATGPTDADTGLGATISTGDRWAGLYDSQVPAEARDNDTCAVVGYASWSSLYDSQVPAGARPGGGACIVLPTGPASAGYESQVPVKARDTLVRCVVVAYGATYDSQVPAAARDGARCVVTGTEPGGSLYNSQVPKTARTQ